MGDTNEILKRPKKPDAEEYAQELLIMGKILNIHFKEKISPAASEDKALAAKFGTEIFDVYARAANKIIPVPQPDGNRWKFLKNELNTLSNRGFQEAKLPAQALEMDDNGEGYWQPLHEERRTKSVGICRLFRKTKTWKGSVKALKSCKASKEKWKESKQLADALGMDDNDVSYSQLLHEERRAKIKGVCRAIKGLGIWKGEAEELEPYFWRFGELEQAEEIRRIGLPFGYYLPDKRDDEERKRVLAALDKEFKTNVALQLFVDLSACRINTLETNEKKRSENPNRLHIILAAGKKGMSAGELERLYHAFGLHPIGIDALNVEERKNLEKALILPADQIVCACIRYFRPMINVVKPLSKENSTRPDEKSRPRVFWCLLYGLLNYYDRESYADTKLNLCDQLFYKPNELDKSSDLYMCYGIEYGQGFEPRDAYDLPKE